MRGGVRVPNQISSSREQVHMVSVKEEARRLLERLPDDLTWDDLMHEIYVRKAIESGLADSEAKRTTPVEEVRTRFGLQP